MKCPRCGKAANGNFCPHCGSPLHDAKCRACNASLVPGGRFCTNCGTAVNTSSRAGWYAAGAALIVLLAVVAWPLLRSNGSSASPSASNAESNLTSSAPPPLTGTPREQADRLFNRVMSERTSGDTSRARFFLPMAIQAYQLAGELDADGLFHLSLLYALAGDYQSAIATAEQILATSPDHLLALSAAAEAAHASGDVSRARDYARRLLVAYDSEKESDRPEYRDHAEMLPAVREQAQAMFR